MMMFRKDYIVDRVIIGYDDYGIITVELRTACGKTVQAARDHLNPEIDLFNCGLGKKLTIERSDESPSISCKHFDRLYLDDVLILVHDVEDKIDRDWRPEYLTHDIGVEIGGAL